MNAPSTTTRSAGSGGSGGAPVPQPPTVSMYRRGENVSFVAHGVRVITRPGNQAADTGRDLDAVFEEHPDYAALVVAQFAEYGVTVSLAEVEAAIKNA